MSILKAVRKNPLLRRLNPLRSLIRTLFRLSLKMMTYRRGFLTNLGGDMPLRLDSRFYFSGYENWGATHNDGFSKLLEICKGQKTVIDAGAHIGLCALSASKVIAPGGTVYAFEPSASNLAYLQKHIKYNHISNVQTCPYLVGENSQDKVPFYESPEPTGMNALIQYKTLPDANWVHRRQISIDDFCQEHQIVPDVIKIDVEGAEVGVLKGAQKTITIHHPAIILSVHPRHLELLGENIQSLLDTISALGYTITDMAGHAVKTFQLREYILQPAHTKVSKSVGA